MAATVSYDDVEVGTALPAKTFPINRILLVQYAGASGDFNPIHTQETFAKVVGLPDVIAHGMYTMAIAARVVTEWAGDPGAVVAYGTRFSKPVVVDSGEGATVEVSGEVTEKLDDGKVEVTLTAVSAGATVLSNARLTVQLA
jgi:acyl dehydratase